MAGRQFRAYLFGCALAAAASVLLAGGPVRAAQPADAPSRLDPLLDRAETKVEKSLAQYSDVACKETVAQQKFGKNGKVEYKENSLFDYVVLFQSASGEPIMTESRLAKEGPSKPKNVPLLLTNGFSTLLLIFHPYYAGGFQFTDQGEESVDGQIYVKVHFQHVKGMRSTTALMLGDREYPLDLQGTALVEKSSGVILKIDATLESSMEDLGLRSLQTEVEYAPISFQGAPQTYWLPTTATIDVESVHQHWRNLHRFTAYHLFTTSVEEKRGSAP